MRDRESVHVRALYMMIHIYMHPEPKDCAVSEWCDVIAGPASAEGGVPTEDLQSEQGGVHHQQGCKVFSRCHLRSKPCGQMTITMFSLSFHVCYTANCSSKQINIYVELQDQ